MDGDWRIRKGVKGCLGYVLDNRHMMDVHFRFVEEDPVVLVSAHRLVLALRSPVFEAMFYGPLAEGSNQVDIPDIDSSVFSAMLRYMYTDDVDLQDVDALAVLGAAHKYYIPGLMEKCSRFLVNTVNSTNAAELFEKATMFDAKHLQYHCLLFFDCYTRDIMKSEGFLSLSRENLERVLSGSTLQADEVAIYQAVSAWTVAECKRRSLDHTIFENRRQVAGNLVRLVRFPVIPPKKFSEEVVELPLGLLTSEETIQLFQMFTSKCNIRDDFIATPRRDSLNVEMLRFQDDGHCRFWYQGLEDEFQFRTNAELVWKGVGFKGSIQRCGCSANIEGSIRIVDLTTEEPFVLFERPIHHQQRPPSDKLDGTIKNVVFDVQIDFDRPIFVSPDQKHGVHLKIKSRYDECECNEICDCYDLLSNRQPYKEYRSNDAVTTFKNSGEAVVKSLVFHRWR